MSTHNLCFGAKVRKIGIPLLTPVLLYKSGVSGGIHCMDVFLMSHAKVFQFQNLYARKSILNAFIICESVLNVHMLRLLSAR